METPSTSAPPAGPGDASKTTLERGAKKGGVLKKRKPVQGIVKFGGGAAKSVDLLQEPFRIIHFYTWAGVLASISQGYQ